MMLPRSVPAGTTASEVAVTQHNVFGPNQPIVTHGPGGFMGELAQLSGRPSLVDAQATKPGETLVIPSRNLRDVMVADDLRQIKLRMKICRGEIVHLPLGIAMRVGPATEPDGVVVRTQQRSKLPGMLHRARRTD